ncbi:MAG: ArnT family glycosyltransferase, partial [Candidatus Binatia bacterium]
MVAVAWVILQLWGLGLTPFHTKGEPREAIVVQDLVRSGDWVLPKRNGVGLPRKPPLFYWLGALSARVGGALDEASVRRPSAVLSGAVALLLSATAAALYGPVAALVSGLALLTSFEWLRAATAARVDMTLTFGLSLVFIALLNFRRAPRGVWLIVLYAGVAWATLAKGIPGLAIPALAVAALCLVDRSRRAATSLRPLRGLLVALLVAGAWYAAATARAGREFLTIVASENLLRVFGGRDVGLGHEHSVGYLAGVLLVGLLPWTLLLPSVAGALWRDRSTLQRGDARLLAVVWSLVVLLPYTLAASKRGVYLLPLYPAVALLLGWWADRLVLEGRTSGWLSGVVAPLLWLLALLLGLLALATAAQWRGLPLLEAATPFVDLRAAADLGRIASAAGPIMAACLAVATMAAVTAALALRRR